MRRISTEDIFETKRPKIEVPKYYFKMESGDQYQANGNTPIYDLPIREIDLLLKKYEADNMALRQEVHEARVKLNDKDEEILRLGRELLNQKKETLHVTRSIMALTEEYSKDQTKAIYKFLLTLYKNNEANGYGDAVVDSTTPYEKLIIEEPAMKNSTSSAAASFPKAPAVPDDEATTCSEDDEQHVKAPLSYQYRHLRLQVCTGEANHEEDEGEKFLFVDHDATMYGVPYEPTGGNARFS